MTVSLLARRNKFRLLFCLHFFVSVRFFSAVDEIMKLKNRRFSQIHPFVVWQAPEQFVQWTGNTYDFSKWNKLPFKYFLFAFFLIYFCFDNLWRPFTGPHAVDDSFFCVSFFSAFDKFSVCSFISFFVHSKSAVKRVCVRSRTCVCFLLINEKNEENRMHLNGLALRLFDSPKSHTEVRQR